MTGKARRAKVCSATCRKRRSRSGKKVATWQFAEANSSGAWSQWNDFDPASGMEVGDSNGGYRRWQLRSVEIGKKVAT